MAEIRCVQVRILQLDQNKKVTDTSLCKIILHNITRFETRTYFESDGSRYGAVVYFADGGVIFVDDDSLQLIEKWCDGKL